MANENAPQVRPIKANWSPEMVDQFNKRWAEFWEWADRAGVPFALKESAVRDAIASLDGQRQAQVLQAYIPALRGPQQ